MRLPAAMNSVELFQDMVRRAGGACGFGDHLLLRVELAVEELLVNVVNYAYPPGSAGWIEVDCEAGGTGELVVTIRDGGRPFNPLEVAAPEIDAALNQREVGGLGVLLVRKMADDIRYEQRGETNVITLRFKGES